MNAAPAVRGRKRGIMGTANDMVRVDEHLVPMYIDIGQLAYVTAKRVTDEVKMYQDILMRRCKGDDYLEQCMASLFDQVSAIFARLDELHGVE